ncbi:hypothetical protein ILUMI_01716, partial [Ignelater luminosus]
VLDDNRKDIDSRILSRKDLLTRKDINNIKQCFKIDVVNGVILFNFSAPCRFHVRHENDAVSVDIWVEGYQKTSFVYYKKQGDDHPILDSTDFCLIFMNAFQEHLLRTFGNHIIGIDSTHGLNSYNFELTTIMVLDEFGEGLPGACMFSNRKDVVVNELFFCKIKERIGTLSPVTFMTDITTVFYNARIAVMGPVEHQLFCSWHVDRAWRSAKKTKRLDKCVHSVISYIRNKVIERIIKATKGKNSTHTSEIEKIHRLSENFNFDKTVSQNAWILKSKTATFSISKMQDEACCKLACSTCKICVHTYKCTCVDYYIKSTICKHIHYVVSKENQENNQNNIVVAGTSTEHVKINEETQIHLQTIGTTSINNDINLSAINDIKNMCNKIKDYCFPNLKESDLLYVKKSLTSVCNFLYTNNSDKSSFNHEECDAVEPPNKKITKQKLFCSTRKSRVSNKTSYTKPDFSESLNIENYFLNRPFISTKSSNDHNYV